MSNATKTFITVVVLAIVAVALAIIVDKKEPDKKISNFDECVAAGYAVLESFPEQCKTPSGQTFVKEYPDVLVESFDPNNIVRSPLTIKGKARGNWFFEASFPVQMKDSGGKLIGQTIATAEGDWMTVDYVPFTATLTFSAPASTSAQIILIRDNPSGLPEHDKQIAVPVVVDSPLSSGACRTTGCSGEICSDKDVVSACIFRPEFICYKSARCERQVNGSCGWTETSALKLCLNANR